MVNGQIFVDNIISETFIGIYPDELLFLQKVKFGFSFEYDWDAIIASDSIEDAVDYAVLTEELKLFVLRSKFKMLEKLVYELAKKVLAFSPKITKARVYCIKLNELKPRAEIELSKP